jgi:hypothetical protein
MDNSNKAFPVGIVSGDPNPKHISTSQVERQNLTMRMSIRRFTRLTNAFSQKGRESRQHPWHSTSCITTSAACIRHCATPAMEAGIADHVWSIEEIVALLG